MTSSVTNRVYKKMLHEMATYYHTLRLAKAISPKNKQYSTLNKNRPNLKKSGKRVHSHNWINVMIKKWLVNRVNYQQEPMYYRFTMGISC